MGNFEFRLRAARAAQFLAGPLYFVAAPCGRIVGAFPTRADAVDYIADALGSEDEEYCIQGADGAPIMRFPHPAILRAAGRNDEAREREEEWRELAAGG